MYPVNVAGIPAYAVVTFYEPGSPADMGYHCPRTAELIDPGQPAANEEVEFRLYDRKGYRARWLDAKIDSLDVHEAVERQVLEAMKRGEDE